MSSRRAVCHPPPYGRDAINKCCTHRFGSGDAIRRTYCRVILRSTMTIRAGSFIAGLELNPVAAERVLDPSSRASGSFSANGGRPAVGSVTP